MFSTHWSKAQCEIVNYTFDPNFSSSCTYQAKASGEDWLDCPGEGSDRWYGCPQDGDVGSCHCYQWRKGCTGARNGGGGGNRHRGCAGLAGIGKDAGLGLFHLQAIFAPPDFGGGSPPDASKTHQATMIGAGGFLQGFAASGCIGSSASGCQPAEESNIYLRIPGFTTSAQN